MAYGASHNHRSRAAFGLLALAAGLTACGSNKTLTTKPPRATAAEPVASAQPKAPLPKGVLANIDLGPATAPFSAVGALGSVWVASHQGQGIIRIDPKTNKVVAKIPTDDLCGLPQALDRHRLVVVNCSAQPVVIDANTNRVVPARTAMGPFRVAGQTWSPTLKGVARVDPRTFKPTRSYPIKVNLRRVADPDMTVTSGDGKIWATVSADEDGTYGGAVAEFDPRTARTVRLFRTPNPGGYTDLRFSDHAVWLKGASNGRLVRLDPSTGRSKVFTLPGWSALADFYPQPLAVAGRDLYVRIRSDRILRFDTRKGRVVASYPADPDGNGGFPTVAFGSLWVPNYDKDSIWRVRIR